jgi:hypothetical protein
MACSINERQLTIIDLPIGVLADRFEAAHHLEIADPRNRSRRSLRSRFLCE